MTVSRSPEEARLLDKAWRLLPGGILGGYDPPADLRFVVRAARGARLFDFSGREYIDHILGSGPLVLGHAHPAVIAAVERQLVRGTTYFQLNEPALELAEEVCRAVPCAEQVRFTSSGTEATFHALRVARAHRKRDTILKFEGGFHGMHDYSLMSVGPRSPKAWPAPTPDSGGIPHVIQDHVLVAPFNDLAETEAIIAAHHQDLAAVIVEPFQRLIPPAPGFLQGVREITARYDIPLVFDEIVTGFRFAYGGAQEYYGVVPDLAAFGKILGGGFPLAAVAGRAHLMRHLSPEVEGTADSAMLHGTLNGNPVAAAAGLATLAELRKPDAYQRLFATGERLRQGLAAAAGGAGLPAQVVGESPVFEIYFTDRPVTDYRATLTADMKRHRAFTRALLERGVTKAAQKFYVSLAHGDAEVERTLEIFAEALGAVAEHAAPGVSGSGLPSRPVDGP
jgi:glutamate-1-semialdehyde 2,1-aminomutase